jgi:glutathionylspermidine synthase
MDDAALVAMGTPPNALAAIRASHARDSVLARFDFIETPDGWRIIECNADTPFLLLEAHRRCAPVVAAHGLADPNAGLDIVLGRALAHAVNAANAARAAAYAITAYDVLEDRETADLLADLIAPHLDRPLRRVPLRSLRMRDGRLVDDAGAIDVLVRLYPLEWFALDPQGDAFLDALAHGRLHTINPPAALLAQNKMLQVLIWQLAASGAYFSAAESALAQRLFLPTFAERPDASGAWIVKPALGREGRGVRYDDGRVEPAVPSVWQRALDPPFVRCGDAAGLAIASCFVVAGEPGAVVLRVGGAVTDASARIVPLALRSTFG